MWSWCLVEILCQYIIIMIYECLLSGTEKLSTAFWGLAPQLCWGKYKTWGSGKNFTVLLVTVVIVWSVFFYIQYPCLLPHIVLMCLCLSQSMISGSLSPRHGASSGCGWRNGLRIWRVAVNTLNKQPQTANKRWSFSLGVGRDAYNSLL
jgi:hypothetical protein